MVNEKKSYRMIAIDLDGTLLSHDGKVTDATRFAVHRALDAGLLICFATGRNFTESQMVLQSVAHYDSAVFVGGAMVMDTRNGVTLHRTVMEADLAAEVCGFLESRGHAVLALQDTNAAGVDYLITEGLPVNDATAKWMTVTEATMQSVPSLSDHAHEHTVRVGIVAPAADMAKVKSELAEQFAQRIYTHSIYVESYGVEILEVFEPGVNKWEGILFVAGRHNVAAEQIIAVGDDVNDLHMIRNAGLGVAMGNARSEVKAAAGKTIGPNTEDGLAKFLNELIDQGLVIPEPKSGA